MNFIYKLFSHRNKIDEKDKEVHNALQDYTISMERLNKAASELYDTLKNNNPDIHHGNTT